ncbi:hypothetical protein SAMN02745117_00592 [Lampropedia hyalina DSM 16112]|uniref:Uncharacterized protein n=1 Tax=Lampropedia hyalina DSM 16112 TaxID=1122156 RepID=A0A1M4V567_9BURK|nr:hypothetical protein [Lampropedia hyalina]SHE64023.1 hypothetical protein SAMN02745117_00592 [Lampropedia hyalina DSM 16112]
MLIYHCIENYHAIAHQVSWLSTLCRIDLSNPAVLDAVIDGDAALRQGNPEAFDKMRGLLVLAFQLVERSSQLHGSTRTAEFVVATITEIEKRRAGH